ncbi:MAG: trehalose 6-phosphate phosphatase [Thermoleophilaceae bacterium]|nr:trehalose 6-phosphate phosphatase [Thermoleophilaceae bacterium]
MSAYTSEALGEALAPLTAAPSRAAVFCDIDGVLAPIVGRAEDAQVRKETSVLLGRLARRYGCVACISGRSAAEARRLVGVGGIVYAGSHGAELLVPGAIRPRINPAFKSWEGRVKQFTRERDNPDLRRLRVRIEDKGPIVALHWRGAPDEEAALARVQELAGEAEAAGLATHWGRKVLELRPPVPFDKGQAVRDLVELSGVRTAMFGGDDTTDLDAFDALEQLTDEGALDAGLRVGVRSDEGPPAIVARADLVVDGVDGFARVLAVLAES